MFSRVFAHMNHGYMRVEMSSEGFPIPCMHSDVKLVVYYNVTCAYIPYINRDDTIGINVVTSITSIVCCVCV